MKLPCLLRPLVSLNAAREKFNRFVDLFFNFRRHVSDLLKRKDAECIQLFSDERTNALDGLQVIFFTDGSHTERSEINTFSPLCDTFQFFCLFGNSCSIFVDFGSGFFNCFGF